MQLFARKHCPKSRGALLLESGLLPMRDIARDLLLGARLLAKTPALTIVAILSLGLGIGANTAIFSIVNALFLHAVPVQDPASLMFVYTLDSRIPGYLQQSYLNYKDYRELNQ